MANRNVMPTLPPQNNPRPTVPNGPNGPVGNGNGGGVNKKALAIIAAVALGIVILLVSKSCSSSNDKPEEPDPAITTAVTTVVTEPVVIEPPDPSENTGTEIPILTEGTIFKDTNKYILASNVAFPETKAVADIVTLQVDEKLSIKPASSCVYTNSANSVNITHTSGSVLNLYRAEVIDRDLKLESADYDAELRRHAQMNGVTDFTFGDVFIHTTNCGRYVRGTVTPAGSTEPMTYMLCYFKNDLQMYTCVILYNSEDACQILTDSITYNRGALQFS